LSPAPAGFSPLGRVAALLRAINHFRGVGCYRISSPIICINVAIVTTLNDQGRANFNIVIASN